MGGSIERNQPRHQGLSAAEWFQVSGRVPDELMQPLLVHHAKLMHMMQLASDMVGGIDEGADCNRVGY